MTRRENQAPGLVSEVSVVVVWLWVSSTGVLVPLMSMVRVPLTSIVMDDLAGRPLALSNKTSPVALVLSRLAFSILKGKAPELLLPGSYFRVAVIPILSRASTLPL